MKTCNECAARDREITRQRKEVERWKDRAATYKKQAAVLGEKRRTQADIMSPLYDDAYLRGVAVGFPKGDSRRETIMDIADRVQRDQADLRNVIAALKKLRTR